MYWKLWLLNTFLFWYQNNNAYNAQYKSWAANWPYFRTIAFVLGIWFFVIWLGLRIFARELFKL